MDVSKQGQPQPRFHLKLKNGLLKIIESTFLAQSIDLRLVLFGSKKGIFLPKI